MTSAVNAIKLMRKEVLLKTRPINAAMAHFDYFYKSVFGKEWPSIRIALLCKKSLCAVVTQQHDFKKETVLNLGVIDVKDIFHHQPITGALADETPKLNRNPLKGFTEEKDQENRMRSDDVNAFVPSTEMIYREEIITEKEYFEFYKPKEETQITSVPCSSITYPSNWNMFVLAQGEVLPFPKLPENIPYLLTDPTNLLPPLALDIQPGDTVLDLCAGTGNKTLPVLLTGLPSLIVANDKKMPAMMNMHRLFGEHNILHLSDLQLSRYNPASHQFGPFDKILVHVPSTNDRLALKEDADNLFKSTRMKERRDIPVLQKNILMRGLSSLALEGNLVYSTSSLSPVQNDSVVHMALQEMEEEEPGKKFEVHDLAPVLRPFSIIFRFSPVPQLGQLVVPSLPLNYGPLYLARIHRTK